MSNSQGQLAVSSGRLSVASVTGQSWLTIHYHRCAAPENFH